MWKTGLQCHWKVLAPQFFSHITPEEQDTFLALPLMAILVSVVLLAGAAALADMWQMRKSEVPHKYEEHGCKGVIL